MSVKQFEGFLAEQFFTWAKRELNSGFRYQFKSPNTDYCKRLFDAIEKSCTGSLTIKDTNISYIEFGDKKLLTVLHSEDPLDDKGFTENFISMLRDEVSAQVGVMSGCVMLIIHNSLLDTLINSAQDLAQPEGVWHPKKIKLALKALIDEKDSGREISEGLLDYQFNVIEEDDATMFGFEALYDAVCDGDILFSELDLFNDPMLFEMDSKPEQIRRRLEENRKLYQQISNVVENYPEALIDNLPDLGNKFINEHFLGEDVHEWQQVTFAEYRIEQDKNRAKLLELESETSVQVEVIAKSKTDTKAGKRNRHILLVVPEGTTEFDLEVSFVGGAIDKSEIKIVADKAIQPLIKDHLTRGTKRSKIVITGEITPSPMFFRFDVNRDKTSEKYQFHCLVLQERFFNVDDYRHIFLIDDKKKRLTLQTVESSLVINPQNQSSFELSDLSQCIDVNEVGTLNFEKMANESDEIDFTLKNNDVSLNFYIEGAIATEALTLPLLLDKGRCIRFFNDDYFGIFNRAKSKVLIDNREVSPKGRRLTLLQREHDILHDDLLYSLDGTKRVITIENLQTSSVELSNAYKELFDYLKQQRSLISLSSWGDSLITVVEKVIEEYQTALEAIPENDLLTDDQKKLLKIGFWENENGKWITPYHPVVLAYYLNLAKEIMKDSESFSKLPSVTINRLNPQGLVPFLFDAKSDFTYSRIEQDNSMWIQLVPQQETSYAFVRRLVKDKVTEFKAAFSALFAGNQKSPLIINSINNGDNNELFLGLVDYMRGQVERSPSIHVNLYDRQLTPCEFDYFSETSSYDEIKLRYGLDKGKARENADVVIDLLRTRLTYSKFTTEESTQEYAHLSFFRNNEKVELMQVDIDEEECGVICKGLISGEASYSKQQSYITGFGLKSLDYSKQPHIKITKLFSTLLQPAERANFPYRHSSAISLAVSDNFRALLERSYDSSIWTTIIDPKVTLDFFENSKDVVLIHYSDQYTNSASYDAITVSRQTELYNKVLEKDEGGIIGEFNAFNGEWLLKMITADRKIRKERKGILGAYKFINCMLKDSDITWVPLSIGEVVRVSGNIGLKITDSDFSRNVHGYKSGAISDDVLFVGFNDQKMYLLPLEVKTGSRPDYKKAIEQARELKRYLTEDILGKSSFSSGLFRGLFIRQVLMQIDKYQLYNVYRDDYFKDLLDTKEWWLQGEYELSEIKDYPQGIVVAHIENSSCFEPNFEEIESVLKIELPMSLLANLVSTPLEGLMSDNLPSALNYCPEHYLLKSHNTAPVINTETEEPIEFVSKSINDNVGNDQNNEPKKEPDSKIKTNERSVRVLIGHGVLDNNPVYWEFDHGDMPNRHLIIFGRSGQGKTYCIQGLLMDLAKHNVNSMVADYTNGFLPEQLESEFNNELKPQTDLVAHKPLDLNPFKKQSQNIAGIQLTDKPHDVAGRIASVFNSVYSSIGEQQLPTLINVIEEGLELFGDDYSFDNMLSGLIDSGKIGEALANKLTPMVKANIFGNRGTSEGWYKIYNDQKSKTRIIQLATLPRDVWRLATEFILWDLYSFACATGNKTKPLPIVLDEVQNLDHRLDSPLGKMLTEGRKYGLSLILATQTLSNLKKDEQDRLFQAAHKLFFAPAETEIKKYAEILEITVKNSTRQNWIDVLSGLRKGQCLSVGYHMKNDGNLELGVQKLQVASLASRKS